MSEPALKAQSDFGGAYREMNPEKPPNWPLRIVMIGFILCLLAGLAAYIMSSSPKLSRPTTTEQTTK